MVKPRVTAMVVVASACGFYLGQSGPIDAGAIGRLAVTALAMVCVVGGANAQNQVVERSHDVRMLRTADRPVAAGRLSAEGVAALALVLSAAGVVLLGMRVNGVCTALAAAAWGLYVLAYTPAKRVGPWSVLVGAIPGALPPMIGWSAATGEWPGRGWVLFAIVFVWQMPHFLGIAWWHREDYAHAGYRVLGAGSSSGRRVFGQMVAYSILLIPVSLLPTFVGLAGGVYYVGAVVLGLAFLAAGIEVGRLQTRRAARQHVAASLIYLTLLFALMTVDKVGA